MSLQTNTFTEPEIVTTTELDHRSYVTFYFNGERAREYHGKCIGLNLNPNRAKSLEEKAQLLKKLQFEVHKALTDNRYLLKNERDTTLTANAKSSIPFELSAIQLLFGTIKLKLKSDLSRTYKRDLKTIYREFRNYLPEEVANGSIAAITSNQVEEFLTKFGSSGTYYMNKRRNLNVLFSGAGRKIDKQLKAVKETSKRRVKAQLHEMYSKEQLKPILEFLKHNYYKLYLGCLFTYGTWLRPHEEIRLLTVGDFRHNYSEIHLSGNDNKGGKVRVVYVPDYIKTELLPLIDGHDRRINIFSLSTEPFNYSYFNTQWSRAYKKMFALGLVYENQTIYSFRHTAAVMLYRRTKDVYLLQKLLGHSSIVVTLKYLRSLGELNSDELRNAAPEL